MPSFELENTVLGPAAGIDEAGRGPLAGPVVAACVHIPAHFPALEKVQDSKRLTPHMREALFTEITRQCAFGIAIADVAEIDQINILQATFLAMNRAVAAMDIAFNITPAAYLVDGNRRPKGMEHLDVRTIVKGDDKSYSIACASILAKVTRDRLMRDMHAAYPHYGWERNAGYGTPDHMAALDTHGPCEHHRQSFAPVRVRLPQTLERKAG